LIDDVGTDAVKKFSPLNILMGKAQYLYGSHHSRDAASAVTVSAGS
jgi:hypothetical protein